MKELQNIYFKIFSKYTSESHINILKKTINAYISSKKLTKKKKNRNRITYKIN